MVVWRHRFIWAAPMSSFEKSPTYTSEQSVEVPTVRAVGTLVVSLGKLATAAGGVRYWPVQSLSLP